jgi:cytochrome c oxidase cbb3-type subunit III
LDMRKPSIDRPTASRDSDLVPQVFSCLLIVVGLHIGAQSRALEPDQLAEPSHPSPVQAPEAGNAHFDSICSACHGIQARGGRGGAPDLLVSPLVSGGQERFREFVRAGSPSAGMPGFALDDQSLNAVQAYLRELASAAQRRGTREIAIVGDPKRGEAYFDGAGGCGQCHSVSGDLQHIGARYNPRVLQGRIVLPRGNGVHPGLLALGMRIPGVTDEKPVSDAPRTVTVTDDRGISTSGVLLSISDFEVTLRDALGNYHSFARHHSAPRVIVRDPAQPHLDRLGQINDQDLHDLTAYLAGIK